MHGTNMKYSMNKKSVLNAKYAVTLLLMANTAAWAEISSLSSEELTDTYIKDTTVIVRQKKPQDTSTTIPVTLKVTPLEQATQVLPEDQTHSTSIISHELSTYDDLNNFRALESNLAQPLPIASTIFLKDPASETALQLIRDKYGDEQNVYDGQPIDLTTLPFLGTIIPSNPQEIPAGVDYQITPNSFTITIPNIGNYNTQQISSPNGEIGVNVTPQNIEYTLNIPN